MKNNKKRFLCNLVFVLIFSIPICLYSQIGIGTTTPRGALEINSSTNGFVPPQVALTALNTPTPIVNPQGGPIATGTIVYNTAVAGTHPNNVVPGYYYWNGTIWVTMSSTNSNWNLNGNSGTTATTNFLGTTDAVDLTIKTNNLERLTVTSSGNIGIGTSSPASKLTINGAVTNVAAYNAGAGTTIDFASSNLAYTTANPSNTFTLNNMKDGGTYTLAVRGTTAGVASFTAPGFTFKIVNNKQTTPSTETIYTFLTIGTVVYAFMVSGF